MNNRDNKNRFPQQDELIQSALEAQVKAYTPYSMFRVGAALLCNNGFISKGCNVENSSYGLSICAERVAVCAAVSRGYRQFTAIAIVGDGAHAPRPCGACVQMLSEFCNDDFIIIMGPSKKPSGSETLTLKELWPKRFIPDFSIKNKARGSQPD